MLLFHAFPSIDLKNLPCVSISVPDHVTSRAKKVAFVPNIRISNWPNTCISHSQGLQAIIIRRRRAPVARPERRVRAPVRVRIVCNREADPIAAKNLPQSLVVGGRICGGVAGEEDLRCGVELGTGADDCFEDGAGVEVGGVGHGLTHVGCWTADDEVGEPVDTLPEGGVVVLGRIELVEAVEEGVGGIGKEKLSVHCFFRLCCDGAVAVVDALGLICQPMLQGSLYVCGLPRKHHGPS